MKVLVLGKGTMGAGITKLFRRNNFMVENFGFREFEDLEEDGRASLSSADLILECVREDVNLKAYLLSKISALNEVAIIGSCTSSLSISTLQMSVRNPERFLGIHFMNPPLHIPSVELVEGSQTSSQVLQDVASWLKSFNRKVIQTTDSPGFILNAILFSMLNKAVYVLQESNQDPLVLDEVLKDVCGHAMGPLTTLDLIGLDIGLQIIENLHVLDPKSNFPPSDLLREYVSKGYFGKKSGRGFFTY